MVEKNLGKQHKVDSDTQTNVARSVEEQHARTPSKNISVPRANGSSPHNQESKMSTSMESQPYQPTDHIASLRKQAMSAPNSPAVRVSKANVVRMGSSNGSNSLNRRIEAAIGSHDGQTSPSLSSRHNEPLTDDEGGTLDIKPMQPIMRSTRYNYLGTYAPVM